MKADAQFSRLQDALDQAQAQLRQAQQQQRQAQEEQRQARETLKTEMEESFEEKLSPIQASLDTIIEFLNNPRRGR